MDIILFIIWGILGFIFITNLSFMSGIMCKKIDLYASSVTILSEYCNITLNEGILLHDGIEGFYKFIESFEEDNMFIIPPDVMYIASNESICRYYNKNSNLVLYDSNILEQYNLINKLPRTDDFDEYSMYMLRGTIPLDVGKKTFGRLFVFSVIEIDSLNDQKHKITNCFLFKYYCKIMGDFPTLVLNNIERTATIYYKTKNKKIDKLEICGTDDYDKLKKVIINGRDKIIKRQK